MKSRDVLSTLMENSPFDYEKQAAIYVVQDMPDPGSSIFSEASKPGSGGSLAAYGRQDDGAVYRP